jgi:hypothetical protein
MSDEHGSADTRRSLTDLERAEIDGIWNDPDDDSPNASADSAGSAVDDDPDGSNGPGGPDSSDGSNGPDGPDEPGTGSEASDSTEGAIPIERRDFLKWGVAGAVADRSWFSSSVGDSGSDEAESLRTVSMKSTPRDYLPDEPYPLSIRGIAPDRSTSQGANVWTGGECSVRALISEQGFNRRPISLREIVTPQRTGMQQATWSSGWENWLDDHERSGATDYNFNRRKLAIQAVARNATGEFRAVGSGHSHSEAARPRSNFSDLKGISGKLPMPWLRDANDQFWNTSSVDRSNLIRLGAGTVLKDLNLHILPGEGLALQNMGSFDGQTLGGAINTATHGTGLGLGSFADLVRSVEIITVPESPIASGQPVVRMFRIERGTDGHDITDPTEFGKDTDRHDMALIQDDEIFRNAVVGYGSLGVATAYTLELRDPYWLRENNYIDSWNNLNLYQEAQNHRHLNVLVDLAGPQVTGNPNPNPLCRVRTQDIVPSRNRAPTERKTIGETVGGVTTAILEEIGELPLEVISNLNDPVSVIEQFPRDLMRSVANAASPFKRGRNETLWHYALRRVPDKTGPQDKPVPPNKAITTEVAVPASQVKPAVETVIRTVQNDSRFFPIPLGIRFTASTDHNFTPEYKREIAMLEFIIPVPPGLRKNINSVKTANDTPGPFGPVYAKPKKIFWQKVRLFFQLANLMHFANLGDAKDGLSIVEDALVSQHAGRPHMGKYNSIDTGASRSYMDPQNMHPNYSRWVEAYDYFNQFGTFDSDFTDNKVQ